MFGICNLTIIPCRSQPIDKSEMVTQLLFGEHFTIIEEREKWILIKIAFDDYECWIDKKQIEKISEEEYNFLNNEPQRLSFEIFNKVRKTGKVENILLGSTLPNLIKGKFNIGYNEYSFRGKTIPSNIKATRNNIVKVAKMYLNSPYLWGGRSNFGIDCSGFTQMVYKLNGIKLPRDAWQQAEKGEVLNFVEEAQRGDLAFFDNDEGKIVHAGIIMNPCGDPDRIGASIIHASGKVRIDTLDHYGIFNAETGRYSHNLRLIKRL